MAPSNSPRARSAQVAKTGVSIQSYGGPIPHPEHFFAYEHVLPGAADRILKMAELQEAHRFRMESKALESEYRLAERGQICGIASVLILSAAAVILGVYGMEVAASVIGGGEILAITGLFIYSSGLKSRERTEKTKIMAGPGLPDKQPEPSSD